MTPREPLSSSGAKAFPEPSTSSPSRWSHRSFASEPSEPPSLVPLPVPFLPSANSPKLGNEMV